MSATSFTVRMFDVFSMMSSELYGAGCTYRDAFDERWRYENRHSRGAFSVRITFESHLRIVGKCLLEPCDGDDLDSIAGSAPRMPNAACEIRRISSATMGRWRYHSSALSGLKNGVLGALNPICPVEEPVVVELCLVNL